MIMLSQLSISNGLNSLGTITMKKMPSMEKTYRLNRSQQHSIMAMSTWELHQD